MATNTYTALQKYTVTGSNLLGTTGVTFDLTGITGYTDLEIVFSGSLTGAAISLIRFNGDSSSSYNSTIMGGNGSTAASTHQPSGTASWLSAYGHLNANQENMIIKLQNYSNTTTNKTFLFRTNNGAGLGVDAGVGTWRSTAAINSIQIFLDRAEYYAVGSTFTVYGIAAEARTSITTPPVAGYSLWLDAGDSSSITQTSNLISQWNDKSGNARHFVASGSYRPTYTNDFLQNGFRTVRFNTSHGMTTSSFDWASSAFTVFTVQKIVTDAGRYHGIFETGSSAGTGIGVSGATSYYSLFKARISPQDFSSNVSYTTNRCDILTVKSSGMSGGSITATAYKNGTSIGTASFSGGSTSSTTAIGYDGNAGDFANMNLCEVLVYPSQLSDTDRTSIEAYLKAKWATV